MVLASLMLAGTLASGGPAVPVQSSMPQACFVYGEVFWSPVQTTAMLSSNCRIHIERQERLIIMKGQNRTIRFQIPEEPGMHEFIYRWGQPTAHFDDELVQVASIIGGGLENLLEPPSLLSHLAEEYPDHHDEKPNAPHHPHPSHATAPPQDPA